MTANDDDLAEDYPGPYFHVSSTLNRTSIDQYGLDWTRMGPAPGIAGSEYPEVAGCYIALDENQACWFVDDINHTGGLVDVWEVSGLSTTELVHNGSGLYYLSRPIPRAQLSMRRTGEDLAADLEEWPPRAGAFGDRVVKRRLHTLFGKFNGFGYGWDGHAVTIVIDQIPDALAQTLRDGLAPVEVIIRHWPPQA
jgi:hypothetical protein